MKSIPVEWVPYISNNEYLLSLLKPQFIKREGLIILKSHYDTETFKTKWIPFIHNHPNDKKRLENTLNHVHLGDVTENIELQQKIGEQLIQIWQNKLAAQFPRLSFEVRLKFYNDEWELQLWTRHNQTAPSHRKKKTDLSNL